MRPFVLLPVVFLGLGSGSALAQDPVHLELRDPPLELPAGTRGEVEVRAALDPGWHIYGLTQPRPPIATSIQIGPDALAEGHEFTQPEPIRRFDDAFGIETEFFEESVSFTVPFSVRATADPGEHTLQASVKYQACTDRVCLPPRTEVLTFAVNVAAPPPGITPPPARAATESAVDDGGAAASPAGAAGAGNEADEGGVAADEPDEPEAETARPTARADAPEGVDSVPASAATEPAAADGAGQVPPIAAAQVAPDGMWAFLLLAGVMGALALLTPCVFPMIPITVSYFSRRGEGTTGAVGRPQVVDAMLYGGGIILAFSGLGLLLAAVYGATGIQRFAANPWINLLVAGLFVGFALDLLGAFELRLPWHWTARLSGQGERGGLLGLLLMGVAFAVTTFTCTVPFVGTLLVAAAGGDWLRPVVGMAAFSTVFAAPFVVLALFPALLGALPRSGSWMGALKVTLGLIELGAALKFLSNADLIWRWGMLRREVVIAAWVALAILAALYLLKQVRLPHEQETSGAPSIGVGRMLASGVFMAVALYLGPGLFGRSVGEFEAFLPPSIYPGEEAGALVMGSGEGGGRESLFWHTSYAAAQEQAAASGTPIFIDFTGYTCTNCRWMEANVFPRAHVRQRLEQYVLVRLYTDGRGEEYRENQRMQLERFGTVALPLYVLVAPNGAAIATFPGLTRDPDEFAAFLDRGLIQGTPG